MTDLFFLFDMDCVLSLTMTEVCNYDRFVFLILFFFMLFWVACVVYTCVVCGGVCGGGCILSASPVCRGTAATIMGLK